MSSTHKGSCVVCGKECNTRCSACAAHGTDWMFFCSKDHQKLIWFTHKRVCGKQGWEWPELSKTEQGWYDDYSLKNRHVRASLSDIETGDSMNGLAYEKMERTFSQLRLPSTVMSCFAREIRYSAFAFRCNHVKISPSERFDRISQDPFGFLTYFEEDGWKDLSHTFDTPYFRDLHHRFLILCTILTIHYKDRQLVEQHKPWISHAMKEVKGQLAKAEGAEDKKKAKGLGEMLDREFGGGKTGLDFAPPLCFDDCACCS
ncbi:zinc finger MYND domain-containing protein [Sporobolomyces salmoneus]|uniref:zinc finger MYND domain-containing protein n=1 Tax=Sporobolomyces salmoneus TaxID=183962 RepID=UPI00317C34A8